MSSITVKGKVRHPYPHLFDGVTDDACFSDYIYDDLWGKVSGGYMRFDYDEENNSLVVSVEYTVEQILNEEDVEKLISYTQGQWSDGIGEGFEQQPIYRNDQEYYLSPWWRGQKAWVEVKYD